jgi:hypothetical protein
MTVTTSKTDDGPVLPSSQPGQDAAADRQAGRVLISLGLRLESLPA